MLGRSLLVVYVVEKCS
uniref:Uncharacterized protein n=1 Tax=Rhizophora mucronata TaxID=61149 RepID=A0A2P2Q4R1_RHIMU